MRRDRGRFHQTRGFWVKWVAPISGTGRLGIDRLDLPHPGGSLVFSLTAAGPWQANGERQRYKHCERIFHGFQLLGLTKAAISIRNESFSAVDSVPPLGSMVRLSALKCGNLFSRSARNFPMS